MPQMMPINWMFSFFFFICVFILFNIMNYYTYNLKSNNMKPKKNIFFKNLNWKW
uniref:ATP synthase complex subunit 8 n=1 Tax=Adoxophyes orana TaxID=480707 RepID=R4IPW9_ADOOR|nr:ATP synthase F0 subunit 8 [Adoxophyes orana]AFV63150.1 ATP synthase FO subunit 8 [Adoxophyes orana]